MPKMVLTFMVSISRMEKDYSKMGKRQRKVTMARRMRKAMMNMQLIELIELASLWTTLSSV